MSKVYKLPLIMVGVYFLIAIIGPLLTPYSPYTYDSAAFLQPSSEHWL